MSKRRPPLGRSVLFEPWQRTILFPSHRTAIGDNPVAFRLYSAELRRGMLWTGTGRLCAAATELLRHPDPGLAHYQLRYKTHSGFLGREGIEPSTSGLKVRCSTN
jgi:hypothetical protein